VLWAYRNTCKKLIRKTLFRLECGQEAIMPMEFLVPSLRIDMMTDLTYFDTVEERPLHLLVLEEDRFIVGFHQKVQKALEKAWHDRHITQKKFQTRDLILLYDSKFLQHLVNFRMHWLGPYMNQYVTDIGVVQ
jgi:hypothetical protein